MILVQNKVKCCGCSACENICPVHAIKMQPDDCGFLYPHVNIELCINCGLCKKVCSFNNYEYRHNKLGKPLEAYFGRSLDKEIVKNSRSGGVFVELSKYIFYMGGIVYGASIDDEHKVFHTRAESIDQIENMRGSKYVQSDIRSTFMQIKNDLHNHMVMFVGTGCQVAGLYGFLQDIPQNLITVDIVCHGVPSQKIWLENIKRIERLKNGKVSKCDFRDKSELGWSTHYESYVINHKKYYRKEYTTLFYSNHILRPSCFECKYTNQARPGDITIADGWGIGKKSRKLDDNRGVSLILINSDVGKKIKEEITHNLVLVECDEDAYLQPNLQAPSQRPSDYDQFWRDYMEKSYEYVVLKYVINTVKILKYYIKKLFNIPLLKLGIKRF